MKNWLDYYQNIPQHLNPEIFRIGIFSFGWYALMYIVAFLVIWVLLEIRLFLGEGRQIFGASRDGQKSIFDFLLFGFSGALIGGRLGYILFYNFSFYLNNPLSIISPFDPISGKLIGIYGMSYHGGLIGVIFASLFYAKKNKINPLALADFIIPAVPLGYFFGRLGNFLNGELYGRITQGWWGMYFTDDQSKALRHPSQLFEALFEGILLFVIFWIIRNKKCLKGNFLALYLLGYSLARFVGEFFREPDEQIGFIWGQFTLGQLFSFAMFLGGIFLLFHQNKKRAII